MDLYEKFLKTKKLRVSFDFDSTLAKYIERTIAWGPIITEYTLNPKIRPYLDQHIKNGDELFLVTSRVDETMSDVWKFLETYKDKVPIASDHVFNTNMAWKRNTLKRLHINVHYDDYKDELDRLKNTKIQGIQIHE
jgi:acid phosphatase class B